MEYEYRVTQPSLRPGATSPIMSDRDVEEWLNEMASKGWEFVGCGVKFWHDILHQQHWIFRRERANNASSRPCPECGFIKGHHAIGCSKAVPKKKGGSR